MKKRIVKKREKMIRNEIHKLLDIVLDINGVDERKQEITGKLPTAFFEFSGHVGNVYISVHDNGWFLDSDPDLCVTIATSSASALSKSYVDLKRGYGSGHRKSHGSGF